MPREDEFRLRDMLIAARNIQRFVSGMTKDEFLADIEKQYAILHGIEVIGEAARHVSDETKKSLDLIPWERIRGMRNRLAHEYFAVDFHTVWDTLENDLSVLIQILLQYIDAPDDDDDFNVGSPVPR